MEVLYHLRPHNGRRNIQRLHDRQQFDKIKEVEGLVLAEPRDYLADLSSGYECWAYIFDRSHGRKIGIDSTDALKAEVLTRPYTDPRPGAIAAYVGDVYAPWRGRLWRVPMHVGNVVEVKKGEITIRSKFGFCDVFEHPINIVPRMYGKYVKFFYIEGLFSGF